MFFSESSIDEHVDCFNNTLNTVNSEIFARVLFVETNWSTLSEFTYEGGSICNENPLITPSTNALGFNAICQTKDQSVAVIMVHKTLF